LDCFSSFLSASQKNRTIINNYAVRNHDGRYSTPRMLVFVEPSQPITDEDSVAPIATPLLQIPAGIALLGKSPAEIPITQAMTVSGTSPDGMAQASCASTLPPLLIEIPTTAETTPVEAWTNHMLPRSCTSALPTLQIEMIPTNPAVTPAVTSTDRITQSGPMPVFKTSPTRVASQLVASKVALSLPLNPIHYIRQKIYEKRYTSGRAPAAC
jgi:hypothetical protein